ncbi:hypothetical protein E3C22_11550 [Jiella endophytica]|uniref:DNA breaking-rejoining protein n=1 Tax=Jiella endophytica TaxID=2558362 RepID=A0A4Y8RLH6_9HYPH|nr:hypothetical protein [Jiella endophytica]TFF23070.1 hypothetical protein E3C22_11550 [Jiella endophytica]
MLTGSAPVVLAQAQSTIHFATGESAARVTGAITGHDYADYRLEARGGQTMVASIEKTGGTGHGTVYFNVLPPGSDGEAIFIGAMEPERRGRIALPRDDDYTLRVYLMGNDRDAGKTIRYALSVTIE